MPVLEEFNTTAAINNSGFIIVKAGKTFSIAQTGLGVGETLDVHIQNAIGSEQLYINDKAIQLSSTHMITAIHGPCKFKLVKGITASGIRVEFI